MIFVFMIIRYLTMFGLSLSQSQSSPEARTVWWRLSQVEDSLPAARLETRQPPSPTTFHTALHHQTPGIYWDWVSQNMSYFNKDFVIYFQCYKILIFIFDFRTATSPKPTSGSIKNPYVYMSYCYFHILAL